MQDAVTAFSTCGGGVTDDTLVSSQNLSRLQSTISATIDSQSSICGTTGNTLRSYAYTKFFFSFSFYLQFLFYFILFLWAIKYYIIYKSLSWHIWLRDISFLKIANVSFYLLLVQFFGNVNITMLLNKKLNGIKVIFYILAHIKLSFNYKLIYTIKLLTFVILILKEHIYDYF